MMSADAYAENASQTGVQLCPAKRSELNVAMAPNPALPKAAPKPGSRDGEKARAALMRRLLRAQRRNDGQAEERRQRDGAGDRAKPTLRVKRGSKRRADSKGREHRRPHPCDDLSGIVRAGEGKTPRRRPGNDEALGAAEDGAPRQQDSNRNARRAEEAQ